VLGDPPKYKLLEKADLISNKRLNRIDRSYKQSQQPWRILFGIKGSIQRSIPHRFIIEE
jgi:hypothetical protein